MKKIIVTLALIIVSIGIVLSIFFTNHSKINYPQNEFTKKISRNMVSEGISGHARLIEENKIEIYVDRNTELDTNTKVDTTINKLISQVEAQYLCSIRIDKDCYSGGPHIDRIVIANYTPKDLQPYVAAPNQLSESDITEKNSHSEYFYYLYTNYFPNDVIDSSMSEITNLTISIFYSFYNRNTIDVSKDFEFLKYFPNLEHLKIIHTENGDCSFENSDENMEQLKKITPEGCIIEFEN